MREIKFRALTLFNEQEWIHGLVYKSGSEGQWTEIQHEDGFSAIVDHESLGQYTGLKDKNGIEIYEGDIVKVSWRKDSAAGRVRWFAYGFYVMGMKRHSPISLASTSVSIEIIGNIYENPELLEGAL